MNLEEFVKWAKLKYLSLTEKKEVKDKTTEEIKNELLKLAKPSDEVEEIKKDANAVTDEQEKKDE